MTVYYQAKAITNKRSIARVKKVDLDQLPIRVIDFSNANDRTWHDQLVNLVDQMISFNKQLTSAKTDHEKTIFRRQINAADNEIDRLVYQLYGLTEAEIKIVESSIK